MTTTSLSRANGESVASSHNTDTITLKLASQRRGYRAADSPQIPVVFLLLGGGERCAANLLARVASTHKVERVEVRGSSPSTMFNYAKAHYFLGPKAVATTCYTQKSFQDYVIEEHASFNPPTNVILQAPEVIAPIPEAVALEHAVSTGSPSSTTVDQDAPSPNIEVAHMGNDPYFGIPIPEVTSDQFSSSDKYGYESCDPVDTPMVEKSKLDEDKDGKAVDPSQYHGMIGTLPYLTASRPDLQFAICMFVYDLYMSSKRQKSAAISITKSEYIAFSRCCVSSPIDPISLIDHQDSLSSRSMLRMYSESTTLLCQYGDLNCGTSSLHTSWPRKGLNFLSISWNAESFNADTLNLGR
ncbi:hypothetical protein Tco_0320803 [Tanacetum coccineum]